jgi:hypothetical protein
MFSESNSRYVVITERPKELSEILTNCKSRIYCRKIGHTSDSAANDTVQYRKGNQILVNLELEKLRLAYNNSLENMLNDVGI